ncbi:MAG: hypothetical protein HUU10_14710 [Bacteroidetes bacterium]|nr:hypothetical protein [Bacteroidota bacterium]
MDPADENYSLYCYTFNNPVVNIDPNGKATFKLIVTGPDGKPAYVLVTSIIEVTGKWNGQDIDQKDG